MYENQEKREVIYHISKFTLSQAKYGFGQKLNFAHEFFYFFNTLSFISTQYRLIHGTVKRMLRAQKNLTCAKNLKITSLIICEIFDKSWTLTLICWWNKGMTLFKVTITCHIIKWERKPVEISRINRQGCSVRKRCRGKRKFKSSHPQVKQHSWVCDRFHYTQNKRVSKLFVLSCWQVTLKWVFLDNLWLFFVSVRVLKVILNIQHIWFYPWKIFVL